MPARRPAATGGPGLGVPSSRLGARQDWTFALFAAVAALAVAFLITRSPLLAASPVVAVATVAGLVRFGRLLPVQLTLVTLPWLVVFDELIPPLLRTLVAGAAAIALLVFVSPLRYDRWMTCIGSALFIVILLAHAVFAVTGDEFIQFAKYLIFPAVALAVVSRRGRELLPDLRNPLLWSGFAAMAVHLVVVALGLGASGTYYGVGEKLGFASDALAEISMLSVTMAGAGLASARRTDHRVALFALGALPAVLTANRAALLATVLILFLYAVRSRLDRRAIVVLALSAVVFFASGAADTVIARFSDEASTYSSVRTVGSGRGSIWQTALSHWKDAGPTGWLFGTGLRSIEQFQLEELGIKQAGHSDIIEVAVQLGIFAWIGWLLIWLGLLRARLSPFVLLPVAVFAVITGTLEFVAPLSFALVLAAACTDDGLGGAPGFAAGPP